MKSNLHWPVMFRLCTRGVQASCGCGCFPRRAGWTSKIQNFSRRSDFQNLNFRIWNAHECTKSEISSSCGLSARLVFKTIRKSFVDDSRRRKSCRLPLQISWWDRQEFAGVICCLRQAVCALIYVRVSQLYFGICGQFMRRIL